METLKVEMHKENRFLITKSDMSNINYYSS